MEISCCMCYFKCVSRVHLMKHVIRYHRFDPQFNVQCTYDGCARTFKRWKSFRQHLYRNHPDLSPTVNDIERHPETITPAHVIPEETYNSNDEVTTDESFVSTQDILQWHVLQFFVNVREKCKISHTAMETIIDGVSSIIKIFLSIVMDELKRKKISDSEAVHINDIQYVIIDDESLFKILSSLTSEKTLDKMLIDKFDKVPAEELIISRGLKWKRKKYAPQSSAKIQEVSQCGYTVSVLDNLRNLLKNEDVRSNLDGHGGINDGVLRTILDGHFYKENVFFRENQDSLALILYYHDLGVVNPLGSSSKTHKLSMFYWTLANIKPEFRSSTNIIQLYAIVKTEYLKMPDGLHKILAPFIADVKILQSERINININGHVKNFKGSLIFCAGDTPAAALLGGFKESVAAYRPCRTCMATNDEWHQNLTRDYDLRNAENHNNHLEIVSDLSITNSAKAFWQKHYGVNSRSPLLNIPHFDVTMCLPQDAMHVAIEGVLETGCRSFLYYLIVQKQFYSLDQLNEQIENFDFKHFMIDKPAPILSHHLEPTGHLRQSAAQLFVIFHTLPFLIGKWIPTNFMVIDNDLDLKEHLHCYTLMLQIINLCLAYEIEEDSLAILNRMITTFLVSFNNLYPDMIVHKFHFLKHIPMYIKFFGPARQQWCFRFEAAHAYFKGLVPVTRNFKNVPITLCYRHQSRLCTRLNSGPGMPSKKFLYQGDYIAPSHSVLVSDRPYANILSEFLNANSINIHEILCTPKIIINGTSYHLGSIVLLKCEEDSLPSFGSVSDIVIVDNFKLIVFNVFQTLWFENKLNAYHVTECVPEIKGVLNVRELIFPHPLSFFTAMNLKYIPLINHQRIEFTG